MFDQSETASLATHLKNHPRVMGALFALTVLLVQAGNAMAGGMGPNPGP